MYNLLLADFLREKISNDRFWGKIMGNEDVYIYSTYCSKNNSEPDSLMLAPVLKMLGTMKFK